jgi:hypothetical protein
MAVRLLTREDVEDAKNPGVKRKERFSFFGKTSFQGDVGRGHLYITKRRRREGDDNEEVEWRRERPGGVVISAFHALPDSDKRVFIESTFEELIKKLSLPRVCIACAANFTFADELGRRNCAWHPGRVVAGEVWSCCNKDWDPDQELKKKRNGCCMTDHNSKSNNPVNRATIVLPLLLAIYLGVPRSAIPAQYWKDQPSPTDTCVVEITTTVRFSNDFVYADAPTKRELIERPNAWRFTLVKSNALPIHAVINA